MRFIETLKKKLKEEDAALLLAYMKTYRVKTKAETQKRLNYHIEKCRTFLSTNRQRGITRKRREYTKKLEYFMQIKKITGKL